MVPVPHPHRKGGDQRAVKGLNPTEYQILTSVPGIGPVYASGILAEVRTHQHKRALALTSRKLIRMLFGLLANGKLYSVEKSR